MPSSLEQIAKIISEGKAKEIVILAGAGISTASGIPDFRSPHTGLYNNLKKYKLPYPEAIFDLAFFKRRPSAFYTLARELYPTGRYRPNIAHYFFRLLHEKSLLRRVYTQNIDGLERVAGIPPVKLVEAHGTFASATCLRCRRNIHTRYIKAAILEGKVARCPACKGLVKPDIVFFTENLPPKFSRYQTDLPKSDLVLVMGTSLEVQPFSNVVYAPLRRTPRVLFNREPVGLFQYSGKKHDYMVLGDISDTIGKLCDLLHWRKEIDTLMAVCEHAKVDYLGLIPDINVHNSSRESSLSENPPENPVIISKRTFSTGYSPARSCLAESIPTQNKMVTINAWENSFCSGTENDFDSISKSNVCPNVSLAKSTSFDFSDMPQFLKLPTELFPEDSKCLQDHKLHLSRRERHNLKISALVASLPPSRINISRRFSYRSISSSFESYCLPTHQKSFTSDSLDDKIISISDEHHTLSEIDDELVFYDCSESLDTFPKSTTDVSLISDSMSKMLLNA